MLLTLIITICYCFDFTNGISKYFPKTLLNPNRTEEIRPFYTHFVPFNDMQNPEAREQFYGFTTIHSMFPDPNEFEYFPEKVINLTRVIELYAEAVADRKRAKDPISLREVFTKTLRSKKPEDLFGEPANASIERIRKASFDLPIMRYYHGGMDVAFTQLLHAWRAFFYVIVNSSKRWKINIGDRGAIGFHTQSMDYWSLLFIKLICKVTSHRASDLKLKVPNGYCPDPCRLGPCLELENTDGGVCIRTGFDRYDYNCTCLPGYAWRTFNKAPGKCQMGSFCKDFCDKDGTMACDDASGRPFCTCRSSHMGPTCKEQRNPCIERFDLSGMPGDIACNVAQGGTCIAIAGTDSYSCKCPPGFTSNTIYYFANCLGMEDHCISTICVQGDCISSPNGKHVFCLCPDDAYGARCEYTRGRWAQWMPWSTCSPSCGLNKLRRRVRTRDCLGKECKGGGGHLEVGFCPVQPCPDEVLARLSATRLQDHSTMTLQLIESRASHFVKLVGATTKVMVLFFCIFVAMAAFMMFVKVQFST